MSFYTHPRILASMFEYLNILTVYHNDKKSQYHTIDHMTSLPVTPIPGQRCIHAINYSL